MYLLIRFVTLIVAHMSNWNVQYAEIVPGIFLYCTTLVCMLPIKRSSFAQVFSASSDRRMRRIPDAVCVCVCVCVCVWVNLWCIFSLLHYECLTGLFSGEPALLSKEYRSLYLCVCTQTITHECTARAIDHNVCTCTCLFIGNTERAEIHFPALSLNSKLIMPLI